MNTTSIEDQSDAVRGKVREGYPSIAQDTSAGCCGPGVSCCGSAPQDGSKLARELGYSVEELQSLPDGAKPSDFITSLEVQAHKDGSGCCGENCCATA